MSCVFIDFKNPSPSKNPKPKKPPKDSTKPKTQQLCLLLNKISFEQIKAEKTQVLVTLKTPHPQKYPT